MQRQITTLSRRGRGEETDEGAERGARGIEPARKVPLANAALTFSELTFAVPGSTVRLHGSYDLHSQEMNFTGDLLTDATLADMTSGFKSLLADSRNHSSGGKAAARGCRSASRGHARSRSSGSTSDV